MELLIDLLIEVKNAILNSGIICCKEGNCSLTRGRSSLVCKELRVQVFHGVVHEGALLPILFCSLQRYYPATMYYYCMLAVLLYFILSFLYKVYIGFYQACGNGQLQ